MIKLKKEFLEGIDEVNVAVSMGEDSLAISHFFSNGKRPVTLHYVNHGTPYAQLAEDKFLKYVEFLKNESSVEIKGIVHKDEDMDSSDFGEAEFREFRYGKFDSYFKGKDWEKERLVVCHHVEDAIENFIMSVLTTGTTKRLMREAVRREGYCVIRPILTSKEYIKNYIKSKGIEKWVVEDPSNQDVKFKRNWVRKELLPKIREGYPGIEKVVKKLYK